MNLKTNFSAALVGCGRMGAFPSESVLQNAPKFYFPISHAAAIKAHPNLVHLSLCDCDLNKVTLAGEKYGISARYVDPVDLLEQEKPDLLCIATRTIGRVDLIKTAIDFGVTAIHVEKPLCNSVSELHAVSCNINRPEIFFTWGAFRRFLTVYRQALDRANSGVYGKLLEIRVNMGAASLYWTHIHSIDLLLFGAGNRRIIGIQAKLDNVVNENSLINIISDPIIVSASIYFEDGVVGIISQAPGSDFIMSCEKGEIIVRSDGLILEEYDGTDTVYPYLKESKIIEDDSPGGTLAPISNLTECLLGNPNAIKLNRNVRGDIILAQYIAFALIQSNLEGSKIIELTSVDPSMRVQAMTNGLSA